MERKIYKNPELLQGISKGVQKLTECVASTIGPYGRNVLIQESNKIVSTNDGWRVVQNFLLDDDLEQIGVRMVSEASKKTNDLVGDSTSLTVLLANSLLHESIISIEGGESPREVKMKLEEGCEKVCNFLTEFSNPVKSIEDIRKIATVSSKSEDIGDLMADLYDEIGFNGRIDYEKSEGSDIVSIIRKGYQIDKGFYDNCFINKDQTSTYEGNSMVWIGNASDFKSIFHIIELSQKENKPLLIISDEIDPELITLYKTNKKNLKLTIIQSPSYDLFRKDLLEDINCYVGGKEYSKGYLGVCQGWICDNKTTLLINGGGLEESINARIDLIKKDLDNSKPSFFNNTLKNRCDKLIGKLALLKIGAPTPLERSNLLDVIDDVVKCCKSSIEEGYSQGAGFTFKRIEEIAYTMNDMELLIPALKIQGKILFNDEMVDEKDYLNIFDSTKGLVEAWKNATSIVSTIILSDYLLF